MSTSHIFPPLAYQMAKCPLPRRDLYDLVGDGTSRDSFKTLTVVQVHLQPDRQTRFSYLSPDALTEISDVSVR